jgi:hypothetical protein
MDRIRLKNDNFLGLVSRGIGFQPVNWGMPGGITAGLPVPSSCPFPRGKAGQVFDKLATV